MPAEHDRRLPPDSMMLPEGMPLHVREAVEQLSLEGVAEVEAIMQLRGAVGTVKIGQLRFSVRDHINSLQGKFMQAASKVKSSVLGRSDIPFDISHLETMRKILILALGVKDIPKKVGGDSQKTRERVFPAALWKEALADRSTYPGEDNARALSALLFTAGGRDLNHADARNFHVLTAYHMTLSGGRKRPIGVSDVWNTLFQSIVLRQYPSTVNPFQAEVYKTTIGHLVAPVEEKAAAAARKIAKHN